MRPLKEFFNHFFLDALPTEELEEQPAPAVSALPPPPPIPVDDADIEEEVLQSPQAYIAPDHKYEERKQRVLALITERQTVRKKDIADMLGVSLTVTTSVVRKMRLENLIELRGRSRDAYWVLFGSKARPLPLREMRKNEIRGYLRTHDFITSSEIQSRFGIVMQSAWKILDSLRSDGELVLIGRGDVAKWYRADKVPTDEGQFQAVSDDALKDYIRRHGDDGFYAPETARRSQIVHAIRTLGPLLTGQIAKVCSLNDNTVLDIMSAMAADGILIKNRPSRAYVWDLGPNAASVTIDAAAQDEVTQDEVDPPPPQSTPGLAEDQRYVSISISEQNYKYIKKVADNAGEDVETHLDNWIEAAFGPLEAHRED